jgi:DNA-binding PadR family transcriptional regulator
MFGNRRHFRELVAGSEERIATNILASRLKQLVAAGLLSREATHRGQRAAYSLTEAGIQMLPVMVALGNCGLAHRDGVLLPPRFRLYAGEFMARSPGEHLEGLHTRAWEENRGRIAQLLKRGEDFGCLADYFMNVANYEEYRRSGQRPCWSTFPHLSNRGRPQ